MKRYPCFWEGKDQSGGWYWIYYGKNRKEIARSSESYVNRADCLRRVRLLKGSNDDPVYYEE